MASCSRCGAETELYDSGVPVCLACANREADREDQPAPQKKPSAKVPPDPASFKTGA